MKHLRVKINEVIFHIRHLEKIQLPKSQILSLYGVKKFVITIYKYRKMLREVTIAKFAT